VKRPHRRRTRGAFGLLGAAIAAAWAFAPRPPAAEPERAPGRLRWNEVCFKAAHNSVDRAEPIPRQLDWDPAVPHDGGCRGVELDIVMDPSRTGPGDDWVFGVQHGGAFKASSPRLDECLRLVRAWSTAHPGHDPIAIHIDIKVEATLGDDADFCAKIDACLDRELERERIFTPQDLRRRHGSLLEAIDARGWPTVETLRDKFIIVFSGGDLDGPVGRRRRAYLEKGHIAFVDLDQRAAGASGGDECDIRNPYYNEGNRVFLNVELGRKDWTRLAREGSKRGFMVRVWKANDAESWKRSLDARIHIVSTDRITGSPWATVGPGTLAPLPQRIRL